MTGCLSYLGTVLDAYDTGLTSRDEFSELCNDPGVPEATEGEQPQVQRRTEPGRSIREGLWKEVALPAARPPGSPAPTSPAGRCGPLAAAARLGERNLSPQHRDPSSLADPSRRPRACSGKRTSTLALHRVFWLQGRDSS
ncbi:hypothetical protein H8959_006758 [Pygathrix nigripes]